MENRYKKWRKLRKILIARIEHITESTHTRAKPTPLLYLINLIDIIKKTLEDWLSTYKYYMRLKEHNIDHVYLQTWRMGILDREVYFIKFQNERTQVPGRERPTEPLTRASDILAGSGSPNTIKWMSFCFFILFIYICEVSLIFLCTDCRDIHYVYSRLFGIN